MTRQGSSSLHTVLQEIELVTEFSTQIAAAAEQQQTVVEDISRSINQISEYPTPTARRCRRSTTPVRAAGAGQAAQGLSQTFG